MTIDIRARVYCSLGEIVQGSLSDTYVQGNGLVFCRGSVTLAGIYQPTLGQVVDFAYEKNGYLSRLPRRLRVLSSFADPFTRQTTIQLGCKLTMLEDQKPNAARIERLYDQAIAASSKSVQYSGAVNVQPKDQWYIPDHLQASIVLADLLAKIDIAPAAAIPLQNRFVVDGLDLSGGYIKVINDLLISENYIGYLNESEQLEIRSTTAENGAGPVLRRDDIIALDAVNSGELPAENVKVEYQYFSIRRQKVDPPEPPPDPPDPLLPPQPPTRKPSAWSYEESIGSPTDTVTYYKYKINNETIKAKLTTTHIPYTRTWTDFNADGSTRHRFQATRSIAHAANTRYFGEARNNGVSGVVSPIAEIWTYVTETFAYDPETGDQTEVTRKTVESAFAASGRLSLPYYVNDYLITPGYDPGSYADPLVSVVTDLTISKTSRVRFKQPVIIKPGNRDKGIPPIEVLQTVYTGITKYTRTSYKNYGATQEGQQAAAWNADNVDTVAEVLDAFNVALYNLVYDDSETRIVNDPNAYSEQLPPGAQELLNRPIKDDPDNPNEKGRPLGQNVNPASTPQGDFETLSIWLMTSGAPSAREQVFRMPYTPDDFLLASETVPGRYVVTTGNAPEKIRTFGRVQNRMLLGHRNGLSLQVAPELMPPRPFDPVYIDLDGLAGQYRVNGLSWAFDANGLACSIDAMFWGGVGTT